MNSFFPHLLNWTYFLLNLERLVSVNSPFRGREFFSLRLAQLYWALIFFAGVGVSAFAFLGYHVDHSPTHNSTKCTIDPDIGMAFRHTLTADVFVGPNLLSFILAVLLFCACAVWRTAANAFSGFANDPRVRSN